MDEALTVVSEMTGKVWEGLQKDLEDVTREEAEWRPLPEANSIALIVRHLAIEAEWHLASLERGASMPHETTAELQQAIDAVPLDFERNRQALAGALARFLSVLETMDLARLRERTAAAYGAWPSLPAHMLGFHQAMHVSMHWGQIRTIRNLYQKSQGKPARYFPENPSYPKNSPTSPGPAA